MEYRAQDVHYAVSRSMSLPGSTVLAGDSTHPRDQIGSKAGSKFFGFPVVPPITNKDHGEGTGKSQPKCIFPDFEDYLKTFGEVCRQYLVHITMELQNERVSLNNQQDRCTYHSVIEAASFLRGRLFRSHSTDARHTADRELLRTTRDMLQKYGPNSFITHLKQADLGQVHSFLAEPAEFELADHMSNNATMAVYNNTAASTRSRTFNDGMLAADTDMSLQSSFNDDPNPLFSVMAGGYSDQTGLSDAYGFPAQSQTIPSELPQQTASLPFLLSTQAQAYEGPFLHPSPIEAYPPMMSSWQDTTQQYDLTGHSYGGPSLATPPAWVVGPAPSIPLSMPRYQRPVDAATVPELVHHCKSDPKPSCRTSENPKRSPVRRGARQRRRSPTPRPIASAVSTQTKAAPDVFVDESPALMSKSPRKRQKVAQIEAVETTTVNYRFQRPVEVSGKSREKLLRESVGRNDAG